MLLHIFLPFLFTLIGFLPLVIQTLFKQIHHLWLLFTLPHVNSSICWIIKPVHCLSPHDKYEERVLSSSQMSNKVICLCSKMSRASPDPLNTVPGSAVLPPKKTTADAYRTSSLRTLSYASCTLSTSKLRTWRLFLRDVLEVQCICKLPNWSHLFCARPGKLINRSVRMSTLKPNFFCCLNTEK